MGVIATLSCSAIDLLLAEHYLEEDSDFYSLVHDVVMMIHAINNNIESWQVSRQPEEWFLEQESFLKNLFGLYERKVKDTQKKLTEIC